MPQVSITWPTIALNVFYWCSALSSAAGVIGALEALLEQGADAGATFTDRDGQVMTPLQAAGKNGVKATQDFFRERAK